jgi:serine/threonine protein kinase
MPPPSAAADFLAIVRRSGLLDDATLSQFPESQLPDDPQGCAAVFVRAGALTPFQARNLLQGRFRGLVVGPYRLLQPLGQGGMGVVYLADHAQLRRQVAIKVLPQDKARDQMALERFYREARAAAALDHPNIVRLHDVCQGAGVHFLVMEYVDGTTLQALLEQTGALHYAQAADYVAQAAAGLQHAHDRGFIHRDVKPANLMVNRQGVVKILDMGLARSFVDPNDQLTATGMDAETAGTADFVAPEQALNQPTDARADVYSLGVTLFTLVTGKVPFEGTSAQKLLQHQFRQPPELTKLRATVPPELGEVVAVMMAKRPEERYQSAEEVIDALRPWLPAPAPATSVAGSRLSDGDIALTPGAGKAKRRRAKRAEPRDWLRRHRWAAAGAAILVLVGGVWAMAGGSKKKSTNTTTSSTTPPSGPQVVPNSQLVPNPPATSPAGGVVASLDAAAIPPFQFVTSSDREVRSGSRPSLPPGWVCEVWNPDAEGEFRGEPVDGRAALRVSSAKGTNAAQFVFRPHQAPDLVMTYDHAYQLRVEYHVDPGIEGYVHLQSAGDYKMFGRTILPNRGPGWHTSTVTIQPGGKGFQVAIGSTKTAPGKFLSLARVELISSGATEAAAATAGPRGAVVYQLDASDLKPFTEQARAEIPPSGPWTSKSLGRTGPGQLPPGWSGFPWDAAAVCEFFADDTRGAMALGLRTVSGKPSAMLHSPTFTAAGGSVRVEVEYRTDPGDVNLLVRCQGTRPIAKSAWDVGLLPRTDGAWRSATLTVDLNGCNSAFLELHNNHAGPSSDIRIRKLVVTDPAAAAEPVAPGQRVFTLDMSRVTPFSSTFQDGQHTNPDWQTRVPRGVYLFCWKKESVAEFRGVVADGRGAVGVTNLNDERSSQIVFQFDDGLSVSLRPGQEYRLRLEYQTTNEAEGKLFVRNPKGGDFPSIAEGQLSATGGLWRTIEVTFRRPADGKLDAILDNTTVGEGNALYFRSLELFEVGPR